MNDVVFDLDGTLIDSSERMYRVFQALVPESELTKDGYWRFKRDKVDHRTLLARLFPDVDFDEFNTRWLGEIERDAYLEMDSCYPDTIEVLGRMAGSFRLVLLTARQSEEGLARELERLGIAGFFSLVLVTANRCTKEDLLGTLDMVDGDWFVSDMGRDILLGASHGYRTVAITHGFMSGERLREYQPEFVAETLTQVEEIVDGSGGGPGDVARERLGGVER